MKDEFWCEVEELFHRALERPARDRAAFLAKACHDRPKVKQEVESLLASHEAADDFIEAPAFEVAPDLVGDALGISLTGRTIGIYAVEEEIGRGGMGVVYLARDTRLGRPVALKALAPQYTRDSHRRRRLQREAQAAASLSHPGIATVYALVEEGDELYIVTEYIRGETLRAEIERGPLA
ncbi:MAG: protein kinase, partial [Acidobacteria bacterium]|nr:protein kinase [Acidobacteriota bacterium]